MLKFKVFFNKRSFSTAVSTSLSDREKSILSLSLTKASQGLKKGEITSVELLNASLKRKKQIQQQSNAFVPDPNEQKHEQQLLEKANQLDKQKDFSKALSGIPVCLKDNLCSKGDITSASSKILSNFISPYDSFVAERLKEEGALIIGKTNMDEFGMGSNSTNSFYGSVRNPLSTKDGNARSAGGSSGGSAVAVASDVCFLGMGSDTGGSVRQPASFCGVVGFKPSYGRISRWGLIEYAGSLDTVGLFVRDVEDAQLAFGILNKHDERDSTSIPNEQREQFDKITNNNEEIIRIGIPQEMFGDALSSDVSEMWQFVSESLRKNNVGVKLVPVSLPSLEYSLSCYYVLACAEAYSNLARYDGVRYGHRHKENNIDADLTLEDFYSKTRSEGFGAEVQRRLLLGSFVLSRKSFDSVYRQAQKLRRIIVNDFKECFEKVDVILTPTSPTTAPLLSEIEKTSPEQIYLQDIMTVSSNLAGVPSISLPTFSNSTKLPIGMQLISPFLQDQKLLRISKLVQSSIKQ